MEGVPGTSMLSFPLRKNAEVATFRNKLKAYIRDGYKEDADSYNQEINELETLRAAAIHSSKDVSGCSTLKKYFCQLHFLRTRFPMMEGGHCAITFRWLDAFSESVHSWDDIEFEMSSILYNIGALHSQLGANDNRQSADGMKNACTHFQCAAGAFHQMRHNYQTFFTQDITPDSLSIMTNICLAQAQECILEKSLIDNRKSTITAKVALQIVEYYQLALKTCDQMVKDSAQYSDKIIKAVKKWKKILELKSHYYDSICRLYRGMQAEDENKYGDRVAFYKSALEKLNEAAKCAKSLEKTDSIHDTIQFTFDVIQGKVAISERENEFIYHEKVPEFTAVSSDIKGVSLVKGIPFRPEDPQIAGPDIFGRLVPIKAHEESSMYSEEKAKILRHYTGKIEAKNEALDKMMIALQLDQIDFNPSLKKIPQELVDCCATLSVNQDVVKRLAEAMAKLSGMYHDVEDDLCVIEDMLKEEETKADEHAEKVGLKRPPSNVIVDIMKELQNYRNAHKTASDTNHALHDTLSKHIGNLQILMKPFDEVMKHIPAFEEENQTDAESIAQMKRLIDKVDEMKKQRVTFEAQLRESIQNDDITNKIVTKGESDLKELFSEELKKQDKITQLLDQNLLAQDNIIRALTEANANYAETRQKTVHVLKRRDKVIDDLISSYESYDDLLLKCSKGIEFYTKLNTSVQKLLQKVKGVVKVHEEEREMMMESIINRTKRMHLNNMGMPRGADTVMNNAISGYQVHASHDGFHMGPNSGLSSLPSSGGHMKLKDVLAMKKQNNIQAQVPIPQVNPGLPAAAPSSAPAHFQPTAPPNVGMQNQFSIPQNQYYNTENPQFQNHPQIAHSSPQPRLPTTSQQPASAAQTGQILNNSAGPQQQYPSASMPMSYPSSVAPSQYQYPSPAPEQIPNQPPVSQHTQGYQTSNQSSAVGYPQSYQSSQANYPPTGTHVPHQTPVSSQSYNYQPPMSQHYKDGKPSEQQPFQSQPQYPVPAYSTPASSSIPQQSYTPQAHNHSQPFQQPQSHQSYQSQQTPTHPNTFHPQNQTPSQQPQMQPQTFPSQSHQSQSQPQQHYPVSSHSNVSPYQQHPKEMRMQYPPPLQSMPSSKPAAPLQSLPQPQHQGYLPSQVPPSQQPAPVEYNPNDSFLAKYVKQYGGSNSGEKSYITADTPSFLGKIGQMISESSTYPSQPYGPPMSTQGINNGSNNGGQHGNHNFGNATGVPQHNQTYAPAPSQQPSTQQQQLPMPPHPQGTGASCDLLTGIDFNTTLSQPLTPNVPQNQH